MVFVPPTGCRSDRRGADPWAGRPGSVWNGYPRGQAVPVYSYGRHPTTAVSTRGAGRRHRQ